MGSGRGRRDRAGRRLREDGRDGGAIRVHSFCASFPVFDPSKDNGGSRAITHESEVVVRLMLSSLPEGNPSARFDPQGQQTS